MRCLDLKVLFVVIMTLTLPSAVTAQFVFRENLTLNVNAIDAQRFEVIEFRSAGWTNMLCAAGIYASQKLGMRRGNVTVDVAYGPSLTEPGRNGVVFTVADVPDAFKTYDRSLREVGKTTNISHARALCSSTNRVQVFDGERYYQR